jgi:HEAT repeats
VSRLTAWLLVAAALLGQPASAEDDVVLVRILRDGQNPRVRAGAANLIGRRRDLGHRPELEVALRDQQPEVRAAAACALGRLGSRSSIAPLNGVADHDRVPIVATEARAAIRSIQGQRTAAEVAADTAPGQPPKARFGLVLGEMRNQSDYNVPDVSEALGSSVERNLNGLPAVRVFARVNADQAVAAQAGGLSIFRVEAAVTSLSTGIRDGQVRVHCEVSLLVLDDSSGCLRTLLKGSARAVEIPAGPPDQQQREIARRVVDAAVRSALRNADSALVNNLR